MNVYAKIRPNTVIVGNKFIHHEVIDSTNNLAQEMFRTGMGEEGLVIIADHQTGGRGQSGKPWISAAYENLSFSVLLEPAKHGPFPGFLINKAASLATMHLVSESIPGARVRIKWPNDIYCNGRKIAGILLETNFQGTQLRSCVLGVGININQYFHNEAFKATSFIEQTKVMFDRNKLLEKWLELFDRLYVSILSGKDNAIAVEFNRNLLGYGKSVPFEFPGSGTRAELVIEGVDENGRLVCSGKPYLHGQIKQILV